MHSLLHTWAPVQHSMGCFPAADGAYSPHIWNSAASVLNNHCKEHSARIKVDNEVGEEVNKCVH
jgi:hypothetical protein